MVCKAYDRDFLNESHCLTELRDCHCQESVSGTLLIIFSYIHYDNRFLSERIRIFESYPLAV